jgi:hypothetical protein
MIPFCQSDGVCSNIQADIVQQALVSLKSGKAVGLDAITNECLKFGGDIIINSLTILFITINDLEQTPSDWQKGIILPIDKFASIYLGTYTVQCE